MQLITQLALFGMLVSGPVASAPVPSDHGRTPVVALKPVTQVIKADSLLNAAQSLLSKLLKPYAGQYTLRPLGHLSDVTVRTGHLALKARPPAGTLLRSPIAVPLEIYVRGQPLESVPVWFSLSISQPVLLFARDLPRDTTLERRDVYISDVDINRLYGKPVTSFEQLRGRSLNIAASKDQPLLLSEFRPTPDVRRNGPVRIIVKSAGVTVIAKGVAEGDAIRGQTVAVRVNGAKGPCEGQVTGKGVVQVDY